MASTTVSHGMISRPMISCCSLPSTSTDLNLSNSMPVSVPFSMMKRTGCRFSTISTPSSSASSSSHGDALKYLRVLRAMTFTSVAPRRFDERQQSIAVLPTPMISTRLPTDVDVAEVNRLEPLDADEDLIGVVAPGNLELLALRRAAADEHGVELLAVEQRLQAVDRRVVAHLDAHVDDVADLFVEHAARAGGTAGMLMRIRPPGRGCFSKIVTS